MSNPFNRYCTMTLLLWCWAALYYESSCGVTIFLYRLSARLLDVRHSQSNKGDGYIECSCGVQLIMLTPLFLTDYWYTIHEVCSFQSYRIYWSIQPFYIFMTSQIKSQSSDPKLAEWNVLLLIIKQYLEFLSQPMKKN